MRALNSAVLPSSLPIVNQQQKQESDRAALPSSFQEALKLGWTIVKEESVIDIKGRQRRGTVLLRLKALPSIRLRVPYTATPQSWKFAVPVLIDAN